MTVLDPKDVSKILGKSLNWVYSNAKELGASRIGGSLFFTKEGIEDAIQRGKAVAGNGNGRWKTQDKGISYQGRGKGLGRKAKKGNEGGRDNPYDRLP